jgi:hypothetical protein
VRRSTPSLKAEGVYGGNQSIVVKWSIQRRVRMSVEGSEVKSGETGEEMPAWRNQLRE